MSRLLIVDDDAPLRRVLVRGLADPEFEIDEAANGIEAIACLERRQYEVIVTDLRMSGTGGLEVLRKALTMPPCPAVILISGEGTIEIAVDAIKAGAFDFVQKPFQIPHIRAKIDTALEVRRLRLQVGYLTEQPAEVYTFDHIVGRNPALLKALILVKKVSMSGATVLIRGETGTGKELIAAAVHYSSGRAARAFVKVNCAALHESLLESELFGHEKGAFTSADKQRIGRFEQADGGTLFLDEIGDMAPSTQAKVLRVLQEHEFERLGSSRTLKTDVRILAATHRNLLQMVADQTFRADLFYRLNVVSIEVPPLRERVEDIPALVAHFIGRLAGALKKPVASIQPDALDKLVRHPWPGNIRELSNVLERAVLLADGPLIGPDDLTFSR